MRNTHDRSSSHFGLWRATLATLSDSLGVDLPADTTLETALAVIEARVSELEARPHRFFVLSAWIRGTTGGSFTLEAEIAFRHFVLSAMISRTTQDSFTLAAEISFRHFILSAWIGSLATTTGELGASQSMLGNIELGGP